VIARGVSPLKIMVNFASASDFVADNSTPKGGARTSAWTLRSTMPTY
jgi:hypothetical protein